MSGRQGRPSPSPCRIAGAAGAGIALARSGGAAAQRFPTEFDGIRMLVHHGSSDPVFSTRALVAYGRNLAGDNGGEAALARWARLFLLPGMTRCGGDPRASVSFACRMP